MVLFGGFIVFTAIAAWIALNRLGRQGARPQPETTPVRQAGVRRRWELAVCIVLAAVGLDVAASWHRHVLPRRRHHRGARLSHDGPRRGVVHLQPGGSALPAAARRSSLRPSGAGRTCPGQGRRIHRRFPPHSVVPFGSYHRAGQADASLAGGSVVTVLGGVPDGVIGGHDGRAGRASHQPAPGAASARARRRKNSGRGRRDDWTLTFECMGASLMHPCTQPAPVGLRRQFVVCGAHPDGNEDS